MLLINVFNLDLRKIVLPEFFFEKGLEHGHKIPTSCTNILVRIPVTNICRRAFKMSCGFRYLDLVSRASKQENQNIRRLPNVEEYLSTKLLKRRLIESVISLVHQNCPDSLRGHAHKILTSCNLQRKKITILHRTHFDSCE